MPSRQPSWRKPAGIAAILLLIVVWAALVGSLSGSVGEWPALVQALFYLVMGMVWIVPLKPLLRWSETGSWSATCPPDRRTPRRRVPRGEGD